MKKILFVTYGGGHVHMVYPVVNALKETQPYLSGELSIQVLGLTGALPILRHKGIQPLGMLDYLDKENDADAISWGRKLAETHHSNTIGITLDESVAYLGLCYKDLVIRYGEEEAARLFAARGRHAFHPISIMQRIMNDIRPDIVITTNSPRSEAAAIDVANERGIPTLAMCDLFSGMLTYKIKARYITFLCDLSVQMFTQDGLIDPTISTFHITGNPAMDELIGSPATKNVEWVTQHYPDAVGKKLVLLADVHTYWNTQQRCWYQKTADDIRQELEAVYAAAMTEGAFFLVRPHPSQDRGLIADWVSGKPFAGLAIDIELCELLQLIDVLVVRASTVGLQAMYLDKKIIQLEPDSHDDLPLAKLGVAWAAPNHEGLVPCMKQALGDDEKAKSMLATSHRSFPRRKASHTISSIILNLLATHDSDDFGFHRKRVVAP